MVDLAASATSVSAHPRAVAPVDAVEVVPAPATPPPHPLVPTVALAVTLGMALTARRRVLVAVLALVLLVLAVETGVHAVHHLTDQRGAADCVVAMASANVQGTAASPPPACALWIPDPVGTVVAPAPERPGARPLRPDEGRAPPAT